MHILSWTHLHGAITHFPIAMLLAGIVCDLGGAFLKKREFRIVGFWMLVIAVLGSAGSLLSGWLAGDLWFPSQKPPIFFQHRLLAFITAILAAILLLWRVKAKDAMTGAALYATLFLGIAIAGVAGFTGYLGGTMLLPDTSSESDNTAIAPPPDIKTAPGTVPGVTPEMVVAGRTAYYSADMSCNNCHMIDGKGGKMAPDLTHEGTKQPDLNWQIEHLKNPQQSRKDSTMPGYPTAPPQTLKAIAAFLVTRK